MAEIGRGLIALMKLQQDRPEAFKLAQSLTLKQDGARIKLNLSIPMSEAVDIIKADAARKAQKDTERAESK